MKNFNGKKSFAISYNPSSDCAPIVSAIGYDKSSNEIEKLALRYGIPVESVSLDISNELSLVDVGEYIPDDCYRPIARILKKVDK